jgi:integrase
MRTNDHEEIEMGWVKARVGTDGKTQYTAVYRDLQGHERSAGTWPTRKRATAEWHKAEDALERGKVSDPKRGRQTLRVYVEKEWFPNHVIEASTRENYTYLLNRYVLPELGHHRMIELLPFHVREWIGTLQTKYGARPPTVREAKVVLDAILTTALNDQVTFLHAGRGVKTPPVARKPRRIITAEQYDAIHAALKDETMQLLVETDIESGLRWGELTELRVKDLDFSTGLLTVSRVVVELKSKDRPGGKRFIVKDYPKDKEWRQLKIAMHLVARLDQYVADRSLSADDLLFPMPQPSGPARRERPAHLPDPQTFGLTEPNSKGKQYWHGTLTAYQAAKCRCRHCKDAVAAYRARRRAEGKDSPRQVRAVNTDGHIPNGWFRTNVWKKALEASALGFHVTPHGLRHAHASWLLAGGADLQVVKERLGHGSITTTDKYLHVLPTADDEALKAMDVIRGRRQLQTSDEDARSAPAVGAMPAAIDPNQQGDSELSQLRRAVAELTDVIGQLRRTS